MCWYMIVDPPLATSKNLVWRTRSNMTMNCEAAMNGVPSTTSADVVRLAQTSSGMRESVMPGARIVRIVTMKLTAVRIDDVPANCTPMLKNVPWSVGSCVESVA